MEEINFRMALERKTILLLLGLVSLVDCPAQQYAIDWHKAAGGGGTSTSLVYSVAGTLAQHDAGGPAAGGNYSLAGGFWSLIATTPTPGVPDLTISLFGSGMTISWPNTGAYILLQNSNLATGS